MKKIGGFFLSFLLVFCICAVPAVAVPLDLTGFTTFGDASESGGTITLGTWNWSNGYFNPSYEVPDDAGVLSFDYSFDLDPVESYDYLTLEINYSPVITIAAQGSDNQSFDLSAYQGQTIDLAWVMWWGGDLSSLSTATVSNIDLASAGAAPVPEPATLLLLGAGMCGLPFLRRKSSR